MGEFLQPAEQGVNDDDVRIQTINSGRQDKVERKAAEDAVPPSKKAICKHPTHKLDEMGPGNRRTFVPNDAAGLAGVQEFAGSERKVVGTFRIEMDCAVIVAGQAFEQLGEGAFRAVPAVNERRNNGQPQVSDSRNG